MGFATGARVCKRRPRAKRDTSVSGTGSAEARRQEQTIKAISPETVLGKRYCTSTDGKDRPVFRQYLA